jgi:hypothetical protein
MTSAYVGNFVKSRCENCTQDKIDRFTYRLGEDEWENPLDHSTRYWFVCWGGETKEEELDFIDDPFEL